MISKRMADTVPASTVPEAISMSSGAVRTSWRSTTSSRRRPMASATRCSTGPQARVVEPSASSREWLVSGFPNPMISNMVKGLSQVA